jgi:hypothetical protein
MREKRGVEVKKKEILKRKRKKKEMKGWRREL